MASRIAIFVLISTSLGRSVAMPPGDPPAPSGEPEPPIPIFLNAPTDLDAFWKRLSRPDFVVLDGELYRKLRRASETPNVSPPDDPAVLEALTLFGSADEDRARLVVEYRINLTVDVPTWVPIQLDGLVLSGVSDGSGDLATRVGESKGWLVELKGRGEHLVRVSLLAPVRSTAEGRRIELAVPPAPSTRVDLIVPRNVIEARTDQDEEVGLSPASDGAALRLSARLSPRSRLELSWKDRADPALKLPTLLSAQGEVSLEVERGSIRSKSSWIVGSIRGTTNQITLRLDAAEELLDIEADGKPVQVGTRREGGRSVVVIPLIEPLRPGSSRAILLNTRRSIASTGSSRVALLGYAFDNAKVQAGVIAVARSGPLYISPTPGRGLRRIDPRTELPESLRGRPDTTLAFEFNDQPYELALDIEPAPPRLRVESRTTVSVAPRSAKLLTRLDCRSSQGRVFEVKVVLPRGLEFEGAGPVDVVESTQVVPLDLKAFPEAGVEVPRVVSITLTPQARESDSFEVLLKGSALVDPSGTVRLPIFRPLLDSGSAGRFAIVSERNVSIEPATSDVEPPQFRVDWGLPPPDWAWPTPRPGPEMGVLWLRSDSNPESIPLKVIVRPRSIRHESTLSASVRRQDVLVVDEIAGEVSFGVLNRLDVAIPPEVPARWEVEGVELAAREPLGQDAEGVRRYRLRFARDLPDNFRLRFRYRLPLPAPEEKVLGSIFRLSPIRALEGTSTVRRILVSAESEGQVHWKAKGWDESPVVEPSPSTSEVGSTARVVLSTAEERPDPVQIEVRGEPRLSLPGVVVSRLWIRTIQRAEDDLDTSARLWVESRDGSLEVVLPSGSKWLRARVGGAEVAEEGVERVDSDHHRIRFPASLPAGPVLVTIDFLVPASSASGAWPTFQLPADGVIQQTIWEARILGSRAGVGTPPGWVDENEWYWAGWLWKRRPWKGTLELTNWLTGGSLRYRPNDPLEAGEPEGYQAYLFSRVGPPTGLRFPVFSRLTLLLLCSGPPLAIGLLILARRPPPRIVAALLLILAFAVGSLIGIDVLILVVQSSTLGVTLWLLSMAISWLIERPGRRRGAGDEALIITPARAESSMARLPSPGSDESTAIRARPITPPAASTADHVFVLRGPGLAPDEPFPSNPEHR